MHIVTRGCLYSSLEIEGISSKLAQTSTQMKGLEFGGETLL